MFSVYASSWCWSNWWWFCSGKLALLVPTGWNWIITLNTYWIITARWSSRNQIPEMGLRLPCPWRSTRRTGSRFLLGQTFLLWYNYEMAKKMTIIVKILMRSWILDKASISKCWINVREDENADHQTLIFSFLNEVTWSCKIAGGILHSVSHLVLHVFLHYYGTPGVRAYFST